ncbi:MAG: hypothetical protein JJD92_06675 [Frankiaceae bacterium]|nr:hypothetical protein [Frankiaceae bacterium]
MKIRHTLPVALTLVVAGGSLAPALAAKAKPKPITASYVAEGVPVPSPLLGPPAPEDANSCINPDLEGVSTTTKTIKTTGAGTLVVGLTGFAGDWDITVVDGDGDVLGVGEGTTTGGEVPVVGGGNGSLGADNTEKLELKLKRAATLTIGVCNFLGGPSANAKYTFTYK